jgi:hypothetical protein
MTPRVLPESTVLAPLDLSQTDSDTWPVFELSDVNVVDPNDASRPQSSLLRASLHYPLAVTGRLKPLSKELSRSYLLPQSNRSPALELTDVKTFSYGAYEDGSIAIWSSGKSGWYLIGRPSATYQHTYDEMVEAVKVLFFIADAYTPKSGRKSKSQSTPPEYTAQQVFEKYASEAMSEHASATDAAETMYKHRDFLFASMIAGKEGLAWGRNPIYLHLKKRFPQEWDRVTQGLARTLPIQPNTDKEVATQHGRQPSVDSTSTSSSLKRKRGRPPKDRSAEVITIDSSSAASSVGIEPTKIDEDNSQLSGRSIRGRQRQHASVTSQPATSRNEASTMVQESQPDSDDDSVRPVSKGKSGLRLKPNKPSKGPPRSSNIPIAKVEEDEESTSLARSPAPRAKRKRRDQPISQPSQTSEVDEGISMPTSPSSTSDQADSQLREEDAVDGAAQTELAIRLNHAPDPVQEDTWICALAGCTHKVYAASRPESQKLIRQHYALHACDDDERVQLVKNLQAPSMPVGHLIERVKMQAKSEGFPGSRVAGTRFPEPLRQKY